MPENFPAIVPPFAPTYSEAIERTKQHALFQSLPEVFVVTLDCQKTHPTCFSVIETMMNVNIHLVYYSLLLLIRSAKVPLLTTAICYWTCYMTC